MVFVDAGFANAGFGFGGAAFGGAAFDGLPHAAAPPTASAFLPLAYCPAEDLAWSRHHSWYPMDARWALGGWMPLIARNPAFWVTFVFYVAFGVAMRRNARPILRAVARLFFRAELGALFVARRSNYAVTRAKARGARVPIRDGLIDERDIGEGDGDYHPTAEQVRVVGGYTPSFVHALACVTLGLAALVRAHYGWQGNISSGDSSSSSSSSSSGGSPWGQQPDEAYVHFHSVLTHSFGYMLADMVVDRDPVYVPHHLGSLLFGELALRLGASFEMAVVFAVCCEVANVRMHGEALRRLSASDATYCASISFVLGVSRVASVVPALLSAACDGVDPYRAQFAIGTVCCAVCIYGSNLASLAVAKTSAAARDIGASVDIELAASSRGVASLDAAAAAAAVS